MNGPDVPDIEAISVTHLLDDDDVITLVADRVGTELPDTFPDGARVRILRVGGTPVDAGTERLDRPLLQVECFAATKADAFDLTTVVLASLRRMPDVAHSGAVVTSVDRVTGPRWAPDVPTNTARYITDVAVYVHAGPIVTL